jgi:RNA polymerase sigma factor (sigma-70 family)
MDPSEDSNFERLIAAMRAGSREAEEKFVATYGPHVRRFVRRTLDPRLRRQIDSDDLIQSVWGAVFEVRERLYTLNRPADVIRYLVRAARNRIIDRYRRHVRAQGSGKDRLQPRSLEGLHRRGTIPANEPSPSHAAAAMELLMRLQEPSNDPQTEVVRRYVLGQNFVEIAEAMGRHPDDVRRLFRQFIREFRRD